MYQLFQRHRSKKKKGFTLIELIIVIAILAILAAILIPNMIGYINEANSSVATANARSVYSAAAAAAAISLTQDPVDPVATITNETVAALGDTGFAGRIKTLLGDNFSGLITVNVNGNQVTSTTWTDEGDQTKTGTYTP